MKRNALEACAPSFAPNPNYPVGRVIEGFEIGRVEEVGELHGTVYLMRHVDSDARLAWIACPDTELTFAIGFKTPPKDDTGVFHIIEHSVLCGSDKFPVKEPFVNLLRTSMQTFLNALTYPDKTLYPVSTTNVADLENLMDVYLDAVFHPAMYTRKEIFEQEGWHYEVAGEDSSRTLSYNGVVFNEMKGATSSPDEVLFKATTGALFPDTAYGFESGGNPRAIPTLSYEEFLDSHARHYTLANSYSFLYGDLDIERELAFIAERFAKVETRSNDAPNELSMQEPVRPERIQVEMATAPENAATSIGYVIGTFAERKKILASKILFDALMGSNESPLKRALLEQGLADDVLCAVIDSILQPVLYFQLKGAKEGSASTFREVLEREVAQLVSNGIDPELLESSLSRAEFNLRERDLGFFTDGIGYVSQMLDGWIYDEGAATLYLSFEEDMTSLRSAIAEGYFEQLLDELVCKSSHTAEVELIATADGAAQEEAAELAKIFASLSTTELDEITREADELHRLQETPDTPESIASVPTLSISDIGEAKPDPVQELVDAAFPLVFHEIETNKIDYVYSYFGLTCVAWEDLPYVGILCEVLGSLGTKEHTAAELDVLVEGNLGNLSFFTETHSEHAHPENVRVMLSCSMSCLSEKLETAASILSEVFSTSDLGDTARIFEQLQQSKLAMEQSYISSGHSAALGRVASYFSRGALTRQALGGVDYYLFIKELLEDFDTRKDELVRKLSDLAQQIFSANNLEMSFTGNRIDLERWIELTKTLSLSKLELTDKLSIPEPAPKHEAFTMPGNVCHVGEGALLTPHFEERGTWKVASRAISLDYLWSEVRMKGGAYGCGFRSAATGLIQLFSFDDPAIDPTLERFENTPAWLRDWQPSEQEFEGYVVSTVSGFDAPEKPRSIARRQDAERFCKRPEGWRERVRTQVLNTTIEDVRSLAAELDVLKGREGLCVFGATDIVACSTADLEVYPLLEVPSVDSDT